MVLMLVYVCVEHDDDENGNDSSLHFLSFLQNGDGNDRSSSHDDEINCKFGYQ